MAKKQKQKVRKDKKQDQKIKALEKFVYKTIENKQLNERVTNSAVTSLGSTFSGFLQTGIGPADGDQSGGSAIARIGNTITLMNQRVNYTCTQALSTDPYNRMRVIIVSSVDGNVGLNLSDILLYSDYALYSNLVFCSPYTTKTDTNKRYKIWSDKLFELNGTAKGATANHKENIKYREGGSPGKLLEFRGDISGLPTNHKLQVFCISDSTVSPHPSISVSVRSTYKDA